MTLEFIPLDRAQALISYDPATGDFSWLPGRRGRCWGGTIAGTTNDRGYRIIYLDGRRYYAHRLAWLFTYGEWPNGEIDHINRDTGDNRSVNLRLASRSQNMANTTMYRNNKSGLKGAYLTKWGWKSTIRRGGKTISLGTFATAEEAHAAFCAAALELSGEYAGVTK